MGVVVLNQDQSMYAFMFDYYDGSNQVLAQSNTLYAVRDGAFDTYYYGNVTSYNGSLPASGTLNAIYAYENNALISYAYGFSLNVSTFLAQSSDFNRLQFALSGDDTIYGFNGYYETLLAGGGNDVISAQGGNDTLLGEAGNDFLYTGEGYDVVRGGTGNDFVYNEGFAGDQHYGDAGNDTLYGAASEDLLSGDADNDYLFGSGGYDTLYGGAGNDSMLMSAGYDYAYGQTGADRFILSSGGAAELDFIMDFSRAQADRVVASSYLAEIGYSVSIANAFTWGYLNIYQASGAAYLYLDDNGVTAGGTVTFLAYVNGVTAANFSAIDII